MKKLTYILILAALALGFAGCVKEDVKEEPVYSSVITPDFSFEDKEYVAGVDAVQVVNNSTATGTEIAGYFWHYGFYGYGSNSEEETPGPILYTNAGEYTITLTVYGADGNKATIRKTVTILEPNSAPLVSFTMDPATPSVGTEVTFTSISSDTDGEVVSYKWTVGGVQAGTEAELKYTFQTAGNTDVTLEVTDDRGGVASTTKTVYVLGDGNGTGTAADPWIIRTAEDWNTMAADMNGSAATYKADANYVIANNLDFTGKEITPIKNFAGVLDGIGNKLTGIEFICSDDNGNKGSGIIYINSGTLRNFTVEGNLTGAGQYFGFVGDNVKGILDGVFINGNVTSTALGSNKRSYAGSLCGINHDGVIVNCGVLGGTLDVVQRYAGGIVSRNQGYVVNCFSWLAEVKCGGTDAGGLVGGEESGGVVINCYSTCDKYSANSTANHDRSACAIGRLATAEVQNIYGVSKPIGQKSASPTYWTEIAEATVSASNMKSGAVKVPSSGKECASFVEALNEGIAIYNKWVHDSKPEGITLRAWVADSVTGYPVFAE